MFNHWNLLRVLAAAGVALLAAHRAKAISVTVSTSAPPPARVGTRVTFSGVASGAGSNLWYRFRVREMGGNYRMIRDYGPSSALEWTASAHEGVYEMEVSARDLDSGDAAAASTLFQFAPVVTAQKAIVSPTNNSLVFLYSAPACRELERMRVTFWGPDGIIHQTPYQDCNGQSMNFYLAGMFPDANYIAYHTVDTGSPRSSSMGKTSMGVTFTTGDLPASLYSDAILVPSPTSASDHILLGSPIGVIPEANDLAGNVLWYGPADISFVTRIEPGGDMWGIVESTAGVSAQQLVRKFDLTGMTLLETNAARVNEQLTAMGKRQISGFHHEARPLSNGWVAVLGDVEQILTDVQGPGPIDVLGDMIVVLDQNLNVVWTWDTFDFLDVRRMAVLGETCPTAGCPLMLLADTGNDWTHGNAIQQTADGNLLYSTRHQDWLIKIAYGNGVGDGHIIWRMGNDGDFTINSTDPYPWFTHQHDGNFEIADPTKLLVFDDGNTRVTVMNGGNSRGQVLQIDEQNLVATPLLNADLGVYSEAVGSAQDLRDGNFHFDAGFVEENNTIDSYSFEVNPSGQITYDAHQNVIVYRSFRLTDMYTPN
ncbi:MAG TPA: aryl-sulfate sulfotransferase [Bryobacteraceae bacterium]|nr:aryl-sulfate sulfotransferase [Bryobacteraceae bacterium]